MCEFVDDCTEDCKDCPFCLDDRLALERGCEEYNQTVKNNEVLNVDLEPCEGCISDCKGCDFE